VPPILIAHYALSAALILGGAIYTGHVLFHTLRRRGPMGMLNAIFDHMDNDDGYCTHCKKITTTGGVEPDATGRHCPECGRYTVIGVEEAVITGKIKVDGGSDQMFDEDDFDGIFG
jgi:hypothetical protein